MAEIKDIKIGLSQVNKLYAGNDLIWEKITDTTAPITTPRPVAGTYDAPQTVWLDVNEACDTYYTTDGSTPTTASTKYLDGINVNATTTLKYFSVDLSGNAEAVKTSVYTINVPVANSWRYLKLEGYGATESGQEVTTRLVEFEAWESATNRMTGATILSGQTPSNAGTGGTLAQIKDGTKTGTSNTYPLWWTSPTPNGNVIIDLLAQRTLTKLNWFGYSVSGAQRTNRFKVLASNTNNGTDWTVIWDNSTGQAGVQGILPLGYEKTL